MRWDLFIFVLLMYLCVSAPYIVGFGIEVTSTETPNHNKHFVVDINWLCFIFMLCKSIIRVESVSVPFILIARMGKLMFLLD